QELADIINKKIPENAAAIAHARSYGDLRENAEFKAAKENQKWLGRRRMELEKIVNETQATDFSDIEITDFVVPGSGVTMEISGGSETYYLLGLYDSDPDRHILSY